MASFFDSDNDNEDFEGFTAEDLEGSFIDSSVLDIGESENLINELF